MVDEQKDGRSGADAPSGSQASPGAADASPPSVSIPNADALIAYAKRAASAIYIAADKVVADDISRTLHQLIRLHTETERALRIRIWNQCKALGMRDAAAYEAIKLEIRRVFDASGIEAPSGDETRSGSAEGESPVGEAETPNNPQDQQ